jgi:hypothetical protein
VRKTQLAFHRRERHAKRFSRLFERQPTEIALLHDLALSRIDRLELEGSVTVTPLQPPLASVHISATGNATQLGRFTLEVPHIVNFATAFGQGTFTFTAANGDTLTADFTGHAQTGTPIFSIVEDATITGGTGRFAGASGSFIVHRSFDPAGGTTTGSFEGTISSPGSGTQAAR